MAQFDSLIIFTLIWSLILTLILHYTVLLKLVIPNFFGVKKVREKKLNYSASDYLNSNSTVKIGISYHNASF